MKIEIVTFWIFKLIAAGILLHTLFFKFFAIKENVYIFSALGIEMDGIICLSLLELLIAILILIPTTTISGAILGSIMMIGAIISHLWVFGIEIQNDNGFLFVRAVITLICCQRLLFFTKNKLFEILKLRYACY
ncbi:DoxX family protein [Flavobacterium hercynium]|uniref:DoxX family protein n=1 Tax=Flavobacterium hercynium TaxID=387094 RepID=A0A226H6T7_9FLAO|nr:DoxX family protein [Flavobacterium hercynium]OXA89548.1 DoxX family protein [Flavobacterium hercynium]SMP35977.1 DoxX-like family protein [Flavobacterium hercynium]